MTDGIKRVDMLRQLYRSKESGASSAIEKELALIKNELAIANDEKSASASEITNATGSPYLSDQPYYSKEVIFNSPAEVDWKEVKSYEQSRNTDLAFKNLKRLNII